MLHLYIIGNQVKANLILYTNNKTGNTFYHYRTNTLKLDKPHSVCTSHHAKLDPVQSIAESNHYTAINNIDI